MGTLNHVHLVVPDRDEAARWYHDVLGFEPVAEYDFWASEVDGGPLQMSADGGHTMIALFRRPEGYPSDAGSAGPAFSVDADTFARFIRALPDDRITSPSGAPLTPDDVVDFDLCWAFDLADPWGNVHELNCFDYDTVRRELIEADGITPGRKWPADVRPAGHPARRED
jgi:catechol 2,3-dioxygenase-like lactoylglutathione lyase family enzyme